MNCKDILQDKELVNELAKRGFKLVPINRDKLAIQDEPKYRLVNIK